jgi:NAD(P)-dependent dehydrogenase (short-subunit alcohol dehydrogenase family)
MRSLAERFRLTDKNAVVTGGTRGIGRAIALGLAETGANVVVASRDAASCAETARAIAHVGPRGIGVCCDVSKEDDVAMLFDRTAADLGGADVLVHCAGLSGAGKASSDVSRADLVRMLDVHLLGGITAAQLAAAQMEHRGGGAILLVTSVWGLGGASRTLDYGVAKAALAHAVRVLAIEWAKKGIRVNGLAPGFVETDMTAELPGGVRDHLIARAPLRRAATADEMVGPAVFLCSDAASFVTGHVLVADGGERAR